MRSRSKVASVTTELSVPLPPPGYRSHLFRPFCGSDVQPARLARASGVGPPSAIEKLDRMEHRDRCPARDLSDAADVSGGDKVGRELKDVGNLAVAQPRGDLRLQNIIGARRTAAQMPFGNVADLKACLRQEPPWQGVDLLAIGTLGGSGADTRLSDDQKILSKCPSASMAAMSL
jgi:hypothetical protein